MLRYTLVSKSVMGSLKLGFGRNNIYVVQLILLSTLVTRIYYIFKMNEKDFPDTADIELDQRVRFSVDLLKVKLYAKAYEFLGIQYPVRCYQWTLVDLFPMPS